MKANAMQRKIHSKQMRTPLACDDLVEWCLELRRELKAKPHDYTLFTILDLVRMCGDARVTREWMAIAAHAAGIRFLLGGKRITGIRDRITGYRRRASVCWLGPQAEAKIPRLERRLRNRKNIAMDYNYQSDRHIVHKVKNAAAKKLL